MYGASVQCTYHAATVQLQIFQVVVTMTKIDSDGRLNNHGFGFRASTRNADTSPEMSVNTSQRLVPSIRILLKSPQDEHPLTDGSYSPRRHAPVYTMKRDASMMVDTQNKRMTPLVSLTQLIKSTKATVSPASVDAAQKTLGPPAPKKTKHKRIRIKTEKRREQCRNNQARYRNRQRGMVNSLDDSIQVLYQEIKKLDVQYQALCYGIQTKQTIWSTAVEYFHLFQYGIPASMQVAYISEQPRKECHDQEIFLRAVMADNVAIGELSGIGALMEQWRRYSTYFDGLHLQLDRLEKQPPEAMNASCTVSLLITETTIRCVFPHLLRSEGTKDERHLSMYSSMCSRLLGKRLDCQCSLRFQWDNDTGSVTRLDTNLDLLTPLLGILGSLDDVSYVLEKAIITQEYLLGELH